MTQKKKQPQKVKLLNKAIARALTGGDSIPQAKVGDAIEERCNKYINS